MADETLDPDDKAHAGRVTGLQHAALSFDVVDDGPIDGPVVVLLHGFPERSTCWREVVPLLHAQGYRTVAMDQRGYSRGARPSRRRDYVTEELAGDVVALIELIGGPVHLVGHDWGAIVGWAVVTGHPELVRSWVAVSVPHPAAFLTAVTRSSQLLKSWYMGFFQLPRLPELAAQKPGGLMDTLLRRTGMTADDVARFRREIVGTGALPYALNWYRALPLSDRSAVSTKATVATTMVWSDGDTALDRAGIDRTEQHVAADYELVVLQGVSHWIPTHAPAALAEAIVGRIESVSAGS